jgi:cytochrome P450
VAFDRFTPEHLSDPYGLYDRVRDRGPFHDPALGLWLVARYDDVRTVLADAERFSSAFDIRTPPAPPPEVAAVLATGHPEVRILLNQDPPDHTAVRALVAGAFSPRRVRTLTPVVQELTDELVDGFAGAGRADLAAALAWPLPLLVTCRLLGLPVEDAPRIRRWVDALTELNSYGTPLDAQLAAAHESVAFETYVAAAIADRRAAPRDDLISELVTALPEPELVSLVITLVFAGHETTANLIANTLLAVLPATGPVDAEAAVEETLRHDPPVQGTYRRAVVDADVGGTVIPAGATVFALIGAANRDPAAYPEPAVFRPDRTGPAHLGLGRGVHFCLGAPVARMEARTAVGTALARLPGLRLTGDPLPYLPNLMHRGPRRLDAVWDQNS